jgi:hypothetical protein
MLIFSSAAEAQSAKKISTFGIVAVAGLSGMFSKQAADKLRDVFDSLFKTEEGKGDEARKDKLELTGPVTEAMLGVNKIISYKMKAGETAKDVKIDKLYELLREIATRIPILDDKGAVQYVIHQSMLYKFISDKSIDMAKAGKPADFTTLTFEDFLGFLNMPDLVEKSLAFVSSKATLGDAKGEMEKTKNCQDVFITQNGGREEPILGWLTNNEISKLLK